MEGLFEHIQNKARELQEFLENDALDIIGVEGINHIEESYENEGFTDKGLEKWEPRKTTTNRGKDKTRYRTNRRGKKGDLTKFGRKNQGRKILTGHGSGGDKLQTAWRAEKGDGTVTFANDKEYAEIHNEGGGDIPKRQQAGESEVLTQKTMKQIDKGINKIMTP